VTGNKGSVSIQQLGVNTKARFTELDSAFAKVKNADAGSKDSLQIVFTNLKKEYIQFIKNFVENEKNNDVACFALNYLGPMMQKKFRISWI